MAKKSKDTIAFGKLIEELQRSSKQASAAASEGGNAGVSVEPDKTTAKIQKEQLDTLNESVGIEQKQDEKLKTLNEQLEKIERALLGMNKKLEKLPKELSNIGPKFSGIKVKEDDKTAKENLSELVGEFKDLFGSVGKGIKSAFEFGKNPIGGIKSGLKKAGTFVADVAGAEAGYTAESDRFATERIKQENAKREDQGKAKLSEQEEDELRKSSREKFRGIVSKEKELGSVEEKIKESKSYGFKPTEGDIEEKNRVIQEIRQQKKEAGLPDFAPVERKKVEEVKEGSEVSLKSSSNTNTNTVTEDRTSSEEVSISNKSLQELSLIRKLTEGSLEYDKEAAQYRNTSGREVTSKVTGKDIKKGGFIDFETAADQLSGQSKRVRESAGVPEVELKSSKSSSPDKTKVEAVNAESDNVQSPQEILAETSKTDLEVTKESNQIFKDQLIELKLIRQALTGTDSTTTPSKKSTDTGTQSSPAQATEDGGPGLLDLVDAGGLVKKTGGAIAKGAKAVGRGALAAGKGIARFAGTGAGKALGAVAAVGMGAYTAYQGYNEAEDNKQAKLDEVQAKFDSGEISSEEAAKARKEIGNTATVEKSGAVGEGTGMAAGAIAGAKAGAAIGTFFGGPIGTGVGALAGGALGAFAGSKAGKVVGEYGGKAINAIKGFFGGGEDTAPGTSTPGTGTGTGNPKLDKLIEDRKKIAAMETPDESAAVKKGREQTLARIDREIEKEKEKTSVGNVQAAESIAGKPSAGPVGEDRAQRAAEARQNAINDGASPQEADAIAAKMMKHGSVVSAGQGRGDVISPVSPQNSNTGAQVANTSVENADLTREATRAPTVQPVVSNSVNNSNTTSYVPVKPSPRPGFTGSALERYTMGVSVY